MLCLNEYQNDELVQLAQWTREMTQARKPNTNPSSATAEQRTVTDRCGRRLRVEMIGRQSLQISVSETVLELRHGTEPDKLKIEVSQFNRLMENIQLPVFAWHNREKNSLELHWQECMSCSVEPSFLKQIKDQTSMIAHALRKRLASWSRAGSMALLQ